MSKMSPSEIISVLTVQKQFSLLNPKMITTAIDILKQKINDLSISELTIFTMIYSSEIAQTSMKEEDLEFRKKLD